MDTSSTCCTGMAGWGTREGGAGGAGSSNRGEKPFWEEDGVAGTNSCCCWSRPKAWLKALLDCTP